MKILNFKIKVYKLRISLSELQMDFAYYINCFLLVYIKKQ